MEKRRREERAHSHCYDIAQAGYIRRRWNRRCSLDFLGGFPVDEDRQINLLEIIIDNVVQSTFFRHFLPFR